jgi:hypothetical protein
VTVRSGGEKEGWFLLRVVPGFCWLTHTSLAGNQMDILNLDLGQWFRQDHHPASSSLLSRPRMVMYIIIIIINTIAIQHLPPLTVTITSTHRNHKYDN